MATSTNTFVREVSNNNSQGTRLGQSDNDLISFYGAAPVANATIVGSNTLSTAVSSNDAFGFGDATTASSIVAICNRLVTLGLIN